MKFKNTAITLSIMLGTLFSISKNAEAACPSDKMASFGISTTDINSNNSGSGQLCLLDQSLLTGIGDETVNFN